MQNKTDAAARDSVHPVHAVDGDHWNRLYYRAKSKYRTNPGSSRIVREVALAGIVADALKEIYPGDDHGDIFVADHTHEELSPGSCSVAWEGAVYSWTLEVWDHPVMRALGDRFGIWFEPVNSCILAVYQSR
jgi:hypothetical protein